MADFYQLTTPDIEFESDLDMTNARELSITFRQLGRDILTVDKDTLIITPTKISYTFKERETGLFTPGGVSFQLRGYTADGRIVETEPIHATVGESYDKRRWQIE